MKLIWLDRRTKEWSCCGYTWQLILSPLYPERKDWHPVCPDCGSTTVIKKVEK